MNVLIACAKSGIMREAFNQYHGVRAVECDLFPCEDGRVDFHIQGNVLDILYSRQWDVLIGHPPCTRIANSGVRWLAKRNLWDELEKATIFFKALLNAKHIPFRRIENPIPHKYAMDQIGVKYSQIIQPWQFGHGETKATCLWNVNLPNIVPTNIVSGREHRIHNMSPSKHRSEDRSRTYVGIAQAIANQTIQYIMGVSNGSSLG